MTSSVASVQDRPEDPRATRRSALTGILLSGVWLFYLVYPLRQAWEERGTARGVAGVAVIVAFAVVYLAIFSRLRALRWSPERTLSARYGWVLLVALVVLAALAVLTLGQAGTALGVYVATATMMLLPTVPAVAVVVAMCVAGEVASRLVPGWAPDAGLTIGIVAGGVAMWGVRQLFERNRQLMLAREENARLAVADERDRFARDLHDILGHSLTVIAMKAELTQRLLETDPERARSEVADVERLARDSLSDVRQAVSGYREASLPGEIARARQALTAAGIRAELPHSTDEVPSALRELFAWSIREGVTNVVRHSGAGLCRVLLTAGSVEVLDDGCGPGRSVSGFGLSGLRERAAAADASVITWDLHPGFGLKVAVRDE